MVLAEANPSGYKELGRLPALNAKTWNYPTLAGQDLLVRNSEEMACCRSCPGSVLDENGGTMTALCGRLTGDRNAFCGGRLARADRMEFCWSMPGSWAAPSGSETFKSAPFARRV